MNGVDVMNKIKKLNVIFAVMYYIFGIIGFYFLFIIGLTSGFMDLSLIFLILFIFLPLLILILPIFFKKVLKKDFYKCVLLSLIGVFIYFIVICIFISYIGTFDESKWKDERYINLRYLMIDDLEDRYDFIGMNKDEVIEILGNDDSNGELCYQTSSIMISTSFYCLKYDENNIIMEIYEKVID